MAYEEDKERLIRELAEAQTQIRGQFGMKPRPGVAADKKDESSRQANAPTT